MSYLKHYLQLHSIFKYKNLFKPIKDINEAVFISIQFGIKSEIVGSWLYCFTTQLIGCQLEKVGFWYSKKHKAYIYSGTKKKGFANDETLEEIKKRLGSHNTEVNPSFDKKSAA